MDVSEKAKELLKKSMKDNDCDCLHVTTESSACCGVSLNFTIEQMKTGDQPTVINGIPVIMNQQVLKETEALKIDVENGQLVINEGISGCSCGSNCC